MKNDFTVEAWVWIGNVERSSYVISVLGQDGDSTHWLGAGRWPRRPGSKSDAENPVVLYFIHLWDWALLFLPFPAASRSRIGGSTWPLSSTAPTRPTSI